MQLKVGKSPGTDDTQAEVYQCGGEVMLSKLRICSPTVGRKGLYRKTPGMQSLPLCAKITCKIQTVLTKTSPYNSVCQKANGSFCQINKHVNHLIEHAQKCKNSHWFIIYLTYLPILQNFDISDKHTKFWVKKFDIAVSIKYDHGHWKWWEQEQLNE